MRSPSGLGGCSWRQEPPRPPDTGNSAGTMYPAGLSNRLITGWINQFGGKSPVRFKISQFGGIVEFDQRVNGRPPVLAVIGGFSERSSSSVRRCVCVENELA